MVFFMNYQEEKKIFFRERIHSLNIFLFLGFNISLISILGTIWLNSSSEKYSLNFQIFCILKLSLKINLYFEHWIFAKESSLGNFIKSEFW